MAWDVLLVRSGRFKLEEDLYLHRHEEDFIMTVEKRVEGQTINLQNFYSCHHVRQKNSVFYLKLGSL